MPLLFAFSCAVVLPEL